MNQNPSETPEPFLILHKVRGLPAFDIAHQIETEGEVMWIVSTSGHRAYPYWYEELTHILMRANDEQWIYRGQPGMQYDGEPLLPDMPEDLPDHYSTTKSLPSSISIHDLLDTRPIPLPIITRRL